MNNATSDDRRGDVHQAPQVDQQVIQPPSEDAGRGLSADRGNDVVAVLKKSAHSDIGKNGYKANCKQFDRYSDGHAVKKYTHICLGQHFLWRFEVGIILKLACALRVWI
jgi:hypothetical protein